MVAKKGIFYRKDQLKFFSLGIVLIHVIVTVVLCKADTPSTPAPDESADTTTHQRNEGSRSDSLPSFLANIVRAIRDVECVNSPTGVMKPCILCNGESSVEVTDDQGHTCECMVCHPATYKKSPCRCTADGEVVPETDSCEVLKPGEGFMPETNMCEKPYPCTTCPGDLISVRQCNGVDDTICECPQDSYQNGPSTCIPKPLCDVDHHRERVYNPGSFYTSYQCAPCPDGMYQPFNNSREFCRPKPSPRSTITQAPQTDYPTSTVNPSDGSCPPCDCNDYIAFFTEPLGVFCNSAVERIHDHWPHITAIAFCIPVAYVIGTFHLISKTAKKVFKCIKSWSGRRCGKNEGSQDHSSAGSSDPDTGSGQHMIDDQNGQSS